MDRSRILAVSPHTDDAELGCGGAIARFVEEGNEVHVAAFSTAERSQPAGSRAEVLKEEFLLAAPILGVPHGNLHVYDFEVRELSSHRQEVLDELIRLRRELEPELVFVPSGNDLHQDHHVVYQEGLRAFKDLSVLGYELPWNHISFSAQAFVRIERKHLDLKWQALLQYHTQLTLNRPYFSMDFIEGLARVRGTQVRCQFAEAFEVLRLRI